MSHSLRKNRNNLTKPSAYSYYKSPKVVSTTRLKNTKSSLLIRTFRFVRHRLSIFRLFILIGFIFIALFLLSADTNPIIRFSSGGVNARDTSIYRTESQKIISKSIFNRSKLLFDYKSVEDELMNRFPEIDSLHITFDIIGRRPVVQLQLRQPAYLYRANNLTWVIDSRGVVIGLKSELKPSFSTSLHTITDEGIVNASTGKTLISSQQVAFITQVISLLEKQQIIVGDVYVPINPKEIDLTVAGESWRYKLNTEERATGQAGTLIAARATLVANNNTPTEYVDIRSGEKVYWK